MFDIESLSQLALSITNAIDVTAYDLNAASFSSTSSISNDYILDNIEFNFSITESKTITVPSADGTKIYEDTNTNQHIVLSDINEAYNGGENFTITVTQFSSAGTMDCIAKIKQGSNTLTGNPGIQWVDTAGTVRGFQNIDGRPRVSNIDYLIDVSKENISGHIHDWSIGERDGVDVVTNGEDIWRGTASTIPIPSVSGEQMTVVSSSSNDTLSGTGVQSIRIYYLDSNGDAKTEDINMNGTVGVNTIATDITFINQMHAISVGSNTVSVGQITIHKLGAPSTVYNLIDVGGNKDLTCFYKVPSSVNFYITEWHGSITGNKPSAIRLRSTDWKNTLFNGANPIFIFKDTAFMAEDSFDRHFYPPIKIPGGSIIKVTAWATQAGGKISANINGFYE